MATGVDASMFAVGRISRLTMVNWRNDPGSRIQTSR